MLDLNDEQGNELVKKLGSSARFWTTDVTSTESIRAAVDQAMQWTKETGKPIGGVIPAAGVSSPAMVRMEIPPCP